jgi:hypothetical protein
MNRKAGNKLPRPSYEDEKLRDPSIVKKQDRGFSRKQFPGVVAALNARDRLNSVLQLQRVIGNQAVQRLFARRPAAPGESDAQADLGAEWTSASAAFTGLTTASVLRIRKAPSTSAPIVGHYPRGTVITILCQTAGTEVDGNDTWNQTDRGFVSDRWVTRSETNDMAKKIRAMITLQIWAGKADPAPPVGPALGRHGINIMSFCKEYNEKTANQAGSIIPAEITVYEDRSFSFVLKPGLAN